MTIGPQYVSVEEVRTYRARFNCALSPCTNFGEVTVLATEAEHVRAIADAVEERSVGWEDGACPNHQAGMTAVPHEGASI